MATGRRAVLIGGAALLAAGGLGGAAWHDRVEDRRAAAAEPAADEVSHAATADSSGDTAVRQGIQQLLDRRAAAVLARDQAALAATVPAAAQALRDSQAAMLANLAQVPLAGWEYRIQALDAYPLPPVLPETERRAARVQLAYRLSGFDTEPVTATQYLTFTRQDGRWLLGSDSDHPGGDTQLWDLGPVTVVHGRSCLVLGLRGQSTLQAIADEADRAVPAVSAVWGRGWGERTVLLAPLGSDQFGRLLGVDPLGYSSIAAVTTGELGPSEAGRTERITVNPQVWDSLNALGRRVVTTHETTHVATRAITEQWTPRWLSEGAANWTGYLGTGRTPRQIAPELLADVAAGRIPAALPADPAFDGSASGLPQAYEQAWFACRSVVQRHGEPRLVALYAAVAATGGSGGQDAAVDAALRRTLGTGLTAFTALWRQDLLAAAKSKT
ncbi:hypothetical protein ACEZCY_08285 [Streptacidiphilus sp. N1-12]|uniref:Peptidase MA superfamily protein n=2 Tax=Streptacidiphilus alkalitolerans TaxID=3342712 RepID=A0ABV6VFF6_9ACTN